jgi:type VI secretion system secreted protein VgrG
MNYHQKYLSSYFLAIAVLLSTANIALAQTAPSLGSASTFAVLGSSTVTCTGLSTITGDVGVSPGSAVTGFPTPCTVVGGAIQAGNAAAFQAHHDAALAYAALVPRPALPI